MTHLTESYIRLIDENQRERLRQTLEAAASKADKAVRETIRAARGRDQSARDRVETR